MAFWDRFTKKHDVEVQHDDYHTNSNFGVFNSVDDDIVKVVNSRSIVAQQVLQLNSANPTWQTFTEDGMMALPIATNKVERIAQYRVMAKFPETQWCLDEIADEFIHEDENGNFINLHLPDNKKNLNETRREILQNEFRKYMNLFRLRDEGFNLIKKFLVEGELAWENVINKDYLKNGIIGIKFLPSEYYETLMDLNTNLKVGLVFDTKKYSFDIKSVLSNNFIGSALVFNAIAPTTFSIAFDKKTCVPMLWSLLTYINSGEYSEDGLVSYPIIEKAKQAYYQLTLLLDAAVILRVTRAPERLLFNVSTGKMTLNYADEYVRRFANGLKQRKTASPNGKDILNTYNPMTMLESYVFGKSDGNDGTSVESVTSTASYDLMEDIKYFFKRYVKQFKVPFSRFEQPENAKPAPDLIPTEEYAFLRMIVRYQRRFADGFRNGFITHLKLRDIWNKYELIDSDIDVQFVKPALYDLFNALQIVETKMNIYKAALGDNEEFAPQLAMKKYLGFTDADILENYRLRIINKQMKAVEDYWGEQVASEKPGGEFSTSPIPLASGDKKEEAENSGESDESGSDESGSEESEGSDEVESKGAEETPEEPKDKEPPAPSFGLG